MIPEKEGTPESDLLGKYKNLRQLRTAIGAHALPTEMQLGINASANRLVSNTAFIALATKDKFLEIMKRLEADSPQLSYPELRISAEFIRFIYQESYKAMEKEFVPNKEQSATLIVGEMSDKKKALFVEHFDFYDGMRQIGNGIVSAIDVVKSFEDAETDMENYSQEDRNVIKRSQHQSLLQEDPTGDKLIESLIEGMRQDTRLDDEERLSSYRYRPTELVIKGAEFAQTAHRNIYPQIEELFT